MQHEKACIAYHLIALRACYLLRATLYEYSKSSCTNLATSRERKTVIACRLSTEAALMERKVTDSSALLWPLLARSVSNTLLRDGSALHGDVCDALDILVVKGATENSAVSAEQKGYLAHRFVGKA